MATPNIPKKIAARQHEITADFLAILDRHLADLLADRVIDMYEIRDVAHEMNIHPTHLSNTIRLTTGHAPCYFFEHKIMDIARRLLETTRQSVAEIARTLTYDPSNFTKFFRHFQGITPKQYREAVWKQAREKTELLTTFLLSFHPNFGLSSNTRQTIWQPNKKLRWSPAAAVGWVKTWPSTWPKKASTCC